MEIAAKLHESSIWIIAMFMVDYLWLWGCSHIVIYLLRNRI